MFVGRILYIWGLFHTFYAYFLINQSQVDLKLDLVGISRKLLHVTKFCLIKSVVKLHMIQALHNEIKQTKCFWFL